MPRSRDRDVIRHGELTVNMLSREVTVGGIKVDLSAKESQVCEKPPSLN